MGPAPSGLPSRPARPKHCRRMRAIIFAGPTLPLRFRPAAEPGIEWRSPVRQGDVYRAALTGPAVIGVIDGYFEIVPTVWHKEILWAMAQGIAKGKALDIQESGPVLGYDTKLAGGSNHDALQGCDVVVVTAGSPRKPRLASTR